MIGAAPKIIEGPVGQFVPDRQHVYWRLDNHVTPEEFEGLNRALAYNIGADTSGWDGGQVLRPPYTVNYGFKGTDKRKDWFNGKPVTVSIATDDASKRYRAAEFEHTATNTLEKDLTERLRSDLANLPSVDSVKIDTHWTEALKESFFLTREEAEKRSPNKRSGSLQRLAYDAVESGLTDLQALALLYDADARWEKYVRRSPSQRNKILSETVARARMNANVTLEMVQALSGETDETDDAAIPIVWDYEAFMDADIPEPPWMFKGLLMKESYGFVTSQPGAGKTQLAIQFAMAAALGLPVMGYANESGPMKVLFFSLEMPHVDIRKYLRSAADFWELDDPKRQMLKRNLAIIPKDRMKTMWLDKAEGANMFEIFLDTIKPDFVVLDSLSEILSKSINDDEIAIKVSGFLASQKVKRRMTTLVLHHNRKIPTDEGKTRPLSLSDMYGSQYWGAKADLVLGLQKTVEPRIVNLHMLKTRATEDGTFQAIRRTDQLQYILHDKEDDFDGIDAPNFFSA